MLASATARPARSAWATSRALRVAACLLVLGCAGVGPRPDEPEAADPTLPDLREERATAPLLGTRFELRFFAPAARDGAELAAAALEAAREVERRVSAWSESSELSQLNAAFADGRAFAASDELARALERCERARAASDGAFDVRIGAFLAGNGYYGADPAAAGPEWGPGSGLGNFVRRGDLFEPSEPGVRLDLGAVSKGLACERIEDVLRAAGIADYRISAGGSLIVARGDEAPGEPGGPGGWAVTVELGAGAPEVWWLRDEALATSGQLSEPFFVEGRLASHVIDPRTARPVDHRLLVTHAVARSPFDADAASTALLVLGPDGDLARAARLLGAHRVARIAAPEVEGADPAVDRWGGDPPGNPR